MRVQRGFTLVEVVVAFAILALSLTALYQSFSLTLRQNQRVERREIALLEAQSLLARVGADLPLKAGTAAGRSERGVRSGPGFDWTVVIGEHAPPRPGESWPVPAFDVAVSVGWGEGEADKVTLHSLQLGAQP